MKYYSHQSDEEWVGMKNYPLHKISCCDCGLVHLLEFRIVDGQVEFRAKRDERATAQVRRHRANK